MKVFLEEHGCDVWYSVVLGYTTSKKMNTASKKELKRNNTIEIDTVLDKLYDLVKDKVGHCALAKELWYKLHNFYFKEYPLNTKP